MAKDLPTIPLALQDVALIDGATCAAAAGISISLFHELVRDKDAPQPAIRQVRCTRWRLADIRTWLIERAERGAADVTGAQRIRAHAAKASAAAAAKRGAATEVR